MAAGLPVRHVVFDWDGTLFDSGDAMHRADNAIADRFGWPQVDRSYYVANMTRDWRNYYDTLRATLGNPALTDEEVSEVHVAWMLAYEEFCESAPLLPDARVVLQTFRDLGLTMSVCSMHGHDRLIERIEEFDLQHYFERVDGLLHSDNGSSKKLAHLQLHIASLETAGLAVSASEMVYVGDTLDDADAAVGVGMRVVLVSTGEMSRDRLVAAADVVVDSLTEVVTSIGTFSR